ncbi:MAG: hypothetical protein Q4E99_02860 [Bacillota bacterium]|nr:hypothetical protein [Bacillota bacterium]
MKKSILSIILISILCLVGGCNNNTNDNVIRDIDYDLTKMSPSAQVEQLLNIYENGSDYVGKTIMLKGKYNKSVYSNKTYHICNIADGNGDYNYSIEFITEQKYPEVNKIITISGTLNKYNEDGQMYLQIIDAKVK